MTGRQRDDDRFTAPAKHFLRPDDRVDSVVAAFRENIGLESQNELTRSVVGEKDYDVHALQRGENVRAVRFIPDWPRRSLEPSDRVVAVDSNDKRITARTRLGENIDMTWMQEIEHAVGEDNAAAEVLPPAAGFLPRHDFF